MADEGHAEEEITTEASRWDDRYGDLFLLILLSLLLSAANTTWLKVVAVVVQGGMVLFAFLVSRAPRRAWRLAIVLVPIAVILGIVGHVSESGFAESVTVVIAVILPVTAIVVLGRRIGKDLPSVNGRTILGLLSVYLLMGMTFAGVFTTSHQRRALLRRDQDRGARGLHLLQLRDALDRRVGRLHGGEPDASDALGHRGSHGSAVSGHGRCGRGVQGAHEEESTARGLTHGLPRASILRNSPRDAVIHPASCPAPTPPVTHRLARSHRRVGPDARTAPRRRRRRRRPGKTRGLEFVGRGSGFTDSDPIGTAAVDPTRRQMRDAIRRAAMLILRAEDELQEAGSVIANGYLRLDREEWIRVVEKRSAALQGR